MRTSNPLVCGSCGANLRPRKAARAAKCRGCGMEFARVNGDSVWIVSRLPRTAGEIAASLAR